MIVAGFDLSTVRVSVGIVHAPVPAEVPEWWGTLSLPRAGTLHARLALEAESLVTWLRGLPDTPDLVAYETPFAGKKTAPELLWSVGAFLVAVGVVWPRVELMGFPSASWKLLATGRGSVRWPAEWTPKQRSVAEKDRIIEWARTACGYLGELSDEADALGVAVAGAHRLGQRGARQFG